MQESAGDEEKLQIGTKGKLLVSLAAVTRKNSGYPTAQGNVNSSEAALSFAVLEPKSVM